MRLLIWATGVSGLLVLLMVTVRIPASDATHCPSQAQINAMPADEAAQAARCAADEALTEARAALRQRQTEVHDWLKVYRQEAETTLRPELERVTHGRCPQALVWEVRLSHYEALRHGMTGEEVLCAVYSPWNEVSRSTIEGREIVIVEWHNSDHGILLVTFLNGRLVSKEARGLR